MQDKTSSIGKAKSARRLVEEFAASRRIASVVIAVYLPKCEHYGKHQEGSNRIYGKGVRKAYLSSRDQMGQETH